MTIQELLLQHVSNKKAARFQSLKNLREILHEPHLVCPFQNTQRSRERDIPAQSYCPADLFIDQKHVRLERFGQQDGLPFSTMQRNWKRDQGSFVYRANLQPCRQRRHASTHISRRSRIRQFLVDGNGDKDSFKQFSEQMLLFDGNQIAEWSGVGDGLHPACMLARVATRCGFE